MTKLDYTSLPSGQLINLAPIGPILSTFQIHKLCIYLQIQYGFLI